MFCAVGLAWASVYCRFTTISSLCAFTLSLGLILCAWCFCCKMFCQRFLLLPATATIWSSWARTFGALMHHHRTSGFWWRRGCAGCFYRNWQSAFCRASWIWAFPVLFFIGKPSVGGGAVCRMKDYLHCGGEMSRVNGNFFVLIVLSLKISNDALYPENHANALCY